MSLLPDQYLLLRQEQQKINSFSLTMRYQQCVKCGKHKDLGEFPMTAGGSGRKSSCRQCLGTSVATKAGKKMASEWACGHCRGPYNRKTVKNCSTCGMPKED